MNEDRPAHSLAEGLMVARFALVGLGATLTHMAVALGLMTLIHAPVFIANLLAFLTAFAVSFFGHYHFTFRSSGDVGAALARFFVIALMGFALNNLVLLSLVKSGVMSDASAVVLAVLAVPAMTYLASRFWGFKL